MKHLTVSLLFSAGVLCLSACKGKLREDLDYSHNVEQVITLDDVSFGEITQFESVRLDLDGTVSLRRAIVDDNISAGRDVLEIGTNTGMIAVICLQCDAKRVVALDRNPVAVANADPNAAALAVDQNLRVRLVSRRSKSPFSAIEENESFDLIIVTSVAEIAAPAAESSNESDAEPMLELLDGLPQHLNSGGRCMVACSHAPTVRTLRDELNRRSWELIIKDDRNLDTLEDNFLPGMLLEIRLPVDVTLDPKSK